MVPNPVIRDFLAPVLLAKFVLPDLIPSGLMLVVMCLQLIQNCLCQLSAPLALSIIVSGEVLVGIVARRSAQWKLLKPDNSVPLFAWSSDFHVCRSADYIASEVPVCDVLHTVTFLD